MIANIPLFILIPEFLLPLIRVQGNPRQCHQTCVSKYGVQTLPYPFGFSSGCGIRLNCTADGGIFIGEFPVQSVNSDNIIVGVSFQCTRSVDSLRQLFSHRYGPTSRNAILMENCSEPILPCSLGSTVENQFELGGCQSRSGNSSCYFENSGNFMIFKNLRKINCQYLLSSISVLNDSSVPELQVGKIELGWGLEGECRCSENANCTMLAELPIFGKPGYRCRCKEGFDGDGYLAGNGCWKASSLCNPAKYMSGKCGGTTRFVVIGGIVLGAILMISLGVMFCCLRRRTKLRVSKSTKIRLTEATENYSVPIYPYKDIERATDSFSEKLWLGTGAHGTVYAGKLHNDEWVAIKRIKHRDDDNIKQVMNEIKLLSSVSHPNLVRLLCFTIEHGEQILVYEFMPNGTLSQHLRRERGNGLSWPVRHRIAVETAEAIAHLHSINPPIFHRDIKSSNILLDHSFTSKVADFGLSRLGMTGMSHISTDPQGTPGYVDPQCQHDFQLSDKSDVYSFGVVLVEMITGLKAVDFSRTQNEVNLASLAIDRIMKGILDEIIDPFLEEDMGSRTLFSIQKVAELAFRCLAFHRDLRPSMMEVAAELVHIRNFTASIELSSASPNESQRPPSVTAKKAAQPEGEGLIRL